jgi:hypothetical protein
MTKRKPGRPALSDKQRRSIALMTMVTKDEAKVIRTAAKKYHSMGEFLRKAALFAGLQQPGSDGLKSYEK